MYKIQAVKTGAAKRAVCVFCAAVISVLFVFSAFVNVYAEEKITKAQFYSALDSFKSEVYANGSKYVNNYSEYRGTECFGFANQIAKYTLGSFPPVSSLGISSNYRNWEVKYGSQALADLHIGDIVRFRSSSANDHSIFITAIDGDTVYYSDANGGGGYNNVRHNAAIQMDLLIEKVDKALAYDKRYTGWVAHNKLWDDSDEDTVLSIKYNASGGQINGTYEGVLYKVTSSNGLKLRKDPGLSGEKIRTMLRGETFRVYADYDLVEVDGYTWAHAVSEQNEIGWAAISGVGDVEALSDLNSSDYYVDGDGTVKISKDDSVLRITMAVGETVESGWALNPEECGLEKEGYVFAGWSFEPDGEVIYDLETDPEKICPDLKYGNVSAVLYAVWAEEDNGDTTGEENPDPIFGDINKDGQANNKDITALFAILSVSNVDDESAYDLNGDGFCNNKDMIFLFRYLSGWEE